MQKFSLREGKEFCLRENEGVVIGDNIYVTVLDIHDDRVRLGITSPNRGVPSYREEILYLEQSEEYSALQMQ